MIPELGDPNREVPVKETFYVQTYDELTEKKLTQFEADDQAIQTILLGLPEDIYVAVDSCETAQEIWSRVQQMMKGSDIGIQEKKAKLFNEGERFTSNGNLNGYNDVQNVGNQVIQNAVQNSNGNGNLVAARAEGNATGHNGNQIRCYNCRGVDLDEIEEVNANCILMANLQQASTSGTQTDKAPVYDSDGLAEVNKVQVVDTLDGRLLVSHYHKDLHALHFGVEDDNEDPKKDPEEDPSEEHEPEDDDEDPEEDPNEEHESKGFEETESFVEDEIAITPPPPRHRGARISIRPQTPMAASTQALIDAFASGSSPFPLPPTSPAYDQRRFALTGSPPGCDVAESSAAAAARAPRSQYDFVDTVEAGQGLLHSPSHDTQTIARAADRAEDASYLLDAQTDHRDIRLEIDVVRGQRTAYETELQERQSAEDLAVTQMMRIHILEARARADMVEDADSNYSMLKENFNLAKHLEINVPNLQAKLMQSFRSKKYVKDTFARIHYYRYSTNDVIKFLRTYLNLPSDIVPITLNKSAKPLGRPMGGLPGDCHRFITFVESLVDTGAGLSVVDSSKRN
nr:40S ribosomal protein S10-1-like [Tanacetum cinerariifolium]